MTPIFFKTTDSPYRPAISYNIAVKSECVSVVFKPNDIWPALRGSISENHPLWRGFQKGDGEHRKNCKTIKHKQKIDCKGAKLL